MYFYNFPFYQEADSHVSGKLEKVVFLYQVNQTRCLQGHGQLAFLRPLQLKSESTNRITGGCCQPCHSTLPFYLLTSNTNYPSQTNYLKQLSWKVIKESQETLKNFSVPQILSDEHNCFTLYGEHSTKFFNVLFLFKLYSTSLLSLYLIQKTRTPNIP